SRSQSKGIELRWRHVVEESAAFVVRQDVRRAGPGTRLLERGDEFLLQVHADADVGWRVFVPALLVVRDDPADLGQTAVRQVVEVVLFGRQNPGIALVVGK